MVISIKAKAQEEARTLRSVCLGNSTGSYSLPVDVARISHIIGVTTKHNKHDDDDVSNAASIEVNFIEEGASSGAVTVTISNISDIVTERYLTALAIGYIHFINITDMPKKKRVFTREDSLEPKDDPGEFAREFALEMLVPSDVVNNRFKILGVGALSRLLIAIDDDVASVVLA